MGTERTYDDKSYVSGQRGVSNWIVLRVEEQGAGITSEGVRANLRGLGGESLEAPDYCAQGETFDCYWEVEYTGGGNKALIGLSYFKDKVGNEGERAEVEVYLDNQGPKVEWLEVYGVGDIGEKDYFQSNDRLKIEMEVLEGSGLMVLVNLNEAVMDAETKFPGNNFTSGLHPTYGWQIFTEEDCLKTEGKWECELETETIKSGYDSSVALEIKVLDTAGNEAQEWPSERPKSMKSGTEGRYKFELLGVDTEEAPDYWEINYVRPLGGDDAFVDMDTTEQIAARMAMKIGLITDSAARIVKVELSGCEAEDGFGAKGREVLFGNLENREPVLILEFAPFNSKEYFGLAGLDGSFETAELTYNCRLNIFSRIGKKAIRNAELQAVEVKVPFGFTELGGMDENLEERVRQAKEGYYDATGWLGTLAEILDWVKYIANIVSVIVTVNQIVDIFGDVQKGAAEKVEKTGVLAGLSGALRGSCWGMQMGQGSSWGFVKYVQIPVGILSCRPISPKDASWAGGWYFLWQKWVLDTYNVATGRGMLGIPASSVYDNFYLSILSLCIPGVVYNLKKLREVHCRKIVCLQREVPQGLATVESCDRLFDLMHCEFFAGPFWSLVPGISTLSVIGENLKAIFQSPLGLISLLDLGVCSVLCFDPKPGGWLTACKVTRFIDKALTIVDSVIGFVKQRPDVQGSPYCDMVQEEDEEEPATPPAAAPTTAAGGAQGAGAGTGGGAAQGGTQAGASAGASGAAAQGGTQAGSGGAAQSGTGGSAGATQ